MSDFLSGAPVPAGRRIILLDVDGTLIDSFPGIRAGFFHGLDEVGHPHPAEEFTAKIAGPPMEQTYASLGLSPEETSRAFDAYMAFTREGGWSRAEAFAGVDKLLPWLKDEGFYIATATSKGENFARAILTELGLLPHIDFLGAAQERGERREKDKVIAYVLDSLELHDRTGDLLMAGDRLHDIEGAKAHGIDTVAVTWGYGAPEEWDLARYVAKSTDELKEIIHDWAN
ncbi:HAD hydrolase-like protein [Corynebacterium doosanense]|uniref:HAD hydrolase-like protein n=1 Tax=Corynebacterium doosanense TaxID=1121358 RepID=UPI00036D8CFB|nr:HAD hydrolase-like protein [Corynebacterium doosanense]